LAVYSPRHNYIFFANPQTASKAIARTLQEALEGQPMPEREIAHGGGVIAKRHHATWRQLQEAGLMTREQLDGLFKFTSVRNPYDLLVSRYLKRKGRFVEQPEKYRWVQDRPKVKASMEAAQELRRSCRFPSGWPGSSRLARIGTRPSGARWSTWTTPTT
jgi:hypothetical protein